MREFDLAIELDRNNAQAYAARASAWLNEGEYDRAIDDYDQAVRLKPESAAYFTGRGFTWHMKGIGDKDRPRCEERALADYAEGSAWTQSSLLRSTIALGYSRPVRSIDFATAN